MTLSIEEVDCLFPLDKFGIALYRVSTKYVIHNASYRTMTNFQIHVNTIHNKILNKSKLPAETSH